MAYSSLKLSVTALGALLQAAAATSAPVPSRTPETITDRARFIPNRAFEPLPGKVIGLLVSDATAVLAAEGRFGPAQHLVLGAAGHSYRWVYVPVERNPTVRGLTIPVGVRGEMATYDKLSLAAPDTVRSLGITTPYALVEVEVNGGRGSPGGEVIVATSMRRLDTTKEYPLDVNDVIAALRQKYADDLRDRTAEIDESLNQITGTSMGKKKLTGPRERSELLFLTWNPKSQRLRAHFRTTITDGAYEYANGIRIELGAIPKPDRPTTASQPRTSDGFRYGRQVRLEFGMGYEVNKEGKLVKTFILPIDTIKRDIPAPIGARR